MSDPVVKQITDKLYPEEPLFITWKRYGFRHIVSEESITPYVDYRNVKYDLTRGTALCGNKYYLATPVNKKDDPWMHPSHDVRDSRRPLCGSCRKKWKKLHGEDLE